MKKSIELPFKFAVVSRFDHIRGMLLYDGDFDIILKEYLNLMLDSFHKLQDKSRSFSEEGKNYDLKNISSIECKIICVGNTTLGSTNRYKADEIHISDNVLANYLTNMSAYYSSFRRSDYGKFFNELSDWNDQYNIMNPKATDSLNFHNL